MYSHHMYLFRQKVPEWSYSNLPQVAKRWRKNMGGTWYIVMIHYVLILYRSVAQVPLCVWRFSPPRSAHRQLLCLHTWGCWRESGLWWRTAVPSPKQEGKTWLDLLLGGWLCSWQNPTQLTQGYSCNLWFWVNYDTCGENYIPNPKYHNFPHHI